MGKITLEFISQPVNDSLRRVWTDKNVEITEETVELTNLLGAMFNRDDSDFADQVNRQQRVILAAEGYTTRLVDEINWLNRAGVTIVGLRYKQYLVGGQEIFSPSRWCPATTRRWTRWKTAPRQSKSNRGRSRGGNFTLSA